MTMQIAERMFFEGLEATVGPSPGLPEGHPRIAALTEREAARSREGLMCLSTACWRRYQGTWQIEGDRLYLVGLVGLRRLIGDEPLLADWVSARLTVRRALAQPDPDAWTPPPTRVFIISVERGLVTEVQELPPSDPDAGQRDARRPWGRPQGGDDGP